MDHKKGHHEKSQQIFKGWYKFKLQAKEHCRGLNICCHLLIVCHDQPAEYKHIFMDVTEEKINFPLL